MRGNIELMLVCWTSQGAGNVVYLDDNESDANTIVEEAPFSESLESEKARLADGEVKRDYRYISPPPHNISPRHQTTKPPTPSHSH